MKKFKKLTAGLLGAVMALSVCSFTAFAEGLTLVNGIDGPNGERVFDNVLFANGEDVTVEPDEEGGLIVKVGNEEFTYSSNTTDAENGALTIFAGGNDDNDDNGEHSDVTIRIKDGAKVNTIFGGGYADSKTDNVRIKIDKGAAALNVYGGGLTSQRDGTSKAQVGNVDIIVDGLVSLLYAGPNSAVGPAINDVIDAEEGTANNYVDNCNVIINGQVYDYFGSSFSYGGIGTVKCTVNGELGDEDISGLYSAVSGANGYTGSAEMIVNEDAVLNTDLYMSMRGYIMGDVVLENYGEIKRVSLNPDGVDVSNNGEYTVINEGTIDICNLDCGCGKKALKSEYPAYPKKITVSGDVTVTGAYWEKNTSNKYSPVEGQTIYLTDGAKLADGESYSNVKVVADTVGDTVVTTEKEDATVDIDGVVLPEDFTADTIKNNVEVAGIENNVKDVVTGSDVEKAKEELEVTDDADIEIKVVTYLDIKVKNYVNTNTEKTFTVDVTPMYKLEATSGNKTETIKNGTKLDVTKEVKVTIPVPSDVFSKDNLFVKHIHNGNTYYYDAELSGDKVTFTNPNGFSLITVFNDNRSGSIKFKNSDGDIIDTKKYNISNIGDKLPDYDDYDEKGYTFKGWVIDGEVYDTFTVELLNLINGDTFTATPKLIKDSSKPSHSYELEEGRVERDDKEDEKNEPVVTPEEEAGPFSDVGKDNPNYDAIIKVYENGWMAGIGDGVFAPNGTLTRAMGATVLWNKAGKPEPQNVAPFLDVTGDAWYAKAVAWAYEQGIIAGYDATTYAPDDALTTEQFTRMNDIANGKTPEIYIGGAPNATRGWVASLLAM